MSRTFLDVIQKENKVSDRRRCEAILDYLPKVFNFVLNECKGHFIGEKDVKCIKGSLDFIVKHGENEHIIKTYIFLLAVASHAVELFQDGPTSNRFILLSHKFYDARPEQCEKVREMAEEAIRMLSVSL